MGVNLRIDHAASSAENRSLMAGSRALHGSLGAPGVLRYQRLGLGCDVRGRHGVNRGRSRPVGAEEAQVCCRGRQHLRLAVLSDDGMLISIKLSPQTGSSSVWERSTRTPN